MEAPAVPSQAMAGVCPAGSGSGRRKKFGRVQGIWKNKGGEADGNTSVDFWAVSNRILTVVACGIFLFIVLRYSFQVQPDTIVLPPGEETVETEDRYAEPTVTAKPTGGSAKQMDISDSRPFDFYREEIARRDLFQNPWQGPGSGTPSSSGSAVEISKQLKLVGILLDDDPKAIIEDAATKQTFFISPGERIGEALVEEIRGDRVILVFHEERVELVP